MNRKEILIAVAAIITTAAETEPDPFPECAAYAALGCDISKWQTVRQVLVESELVTIRGDRISLTDKGRELATKCQATLPREVG